MKDAFKDVYSVEIGDDLYNAAKQKFRNSKNVHLFHGDSGKVLAELLYRIDQPALFWLDGHYSAGITAKGSKM